jgi:ABC-type amino acid transport substrate-binding protein
MERSTSVLDTILERGSVRIPVVWWDPPEMGDPPEFFHDPETGRPTGVVPELARVLADDLSVELELIEVPWDQHMQTVLDGGVDLLLSFTNTPERALRLDFAGRLLPDSVSALVRVEGDVKSYDDLAVSGRSIGVPRGSSVADIAKRHFPDVAVVESDDPLVDLEAGRVDGVVDSAITKSLLAHHPLLDVVRDQDGKARVLAMEYGHPAIRQGDPRLLNWIDNWLVYHQAAGTIDRWCGSYWTRWMVE